MRGGDWRENGSAVGGWCVRYLLRVYGARGRGPVDGIFIWTPSHDQRSRSLSTGRRSLLNRSPGHHDGSMSGKGQASPRGGDRGDGRAQREAPTLNELVRFAAQLPDDQAAALLRRARPASRSVDSEEIAGVPLRLLPRSSVCGKPFVRRNVRQKYCPDHKGGAHCGSLAVEKRPSTATGQPLPWDAVGRRIGSLGHRIARFNRGTNALSNLCWSCLWCNTWPDDRKRGATDHGGWHPETIEQERRRREDRGKIEQPRAERDAHRAQPKRLHAGQPLDRHTTRLLAGPCGRCCGLVTR